MSYERLQYLFERYADKSCTKEEKEELSALALAADNEHWVKALLEKYWDKEVVPENMSEMKASHILHSILDNAPVQEETDLSPTIKKIHWHKLTAAAVVITMLGAALFFYTHRASRKSPSGQETQQDRFRNDIAAPVHNKATLTVANGTTIVLDTLAMGASVANANKITEGTIAYSDRSADIEYHTLSVPAGSRPMQLQLADGTRMWLNVGSSVTYPTRFTGNERSVTLSGEAYFEVARNIQMKFVVNTGKTITEVLGTHFNVNSYANETATRITLLEGKVKVGSAGTNFSQVLTPGQQAQVMPGSEKLTVINGVDTEEVMAWKNGIFHFQKSDLPSIMRQVSRWYDMDIIFETEINAKFGGSIPMNVNLSQLLSMLETTGHVHFKIEGKTITVMP